MKKNLITAVIAATVAIASLTGCTQEPTPAPTSTSAATSAPAATASSTPTATEAPTEAPAAETPTGPTKEEADALKADVILTVAAGTNSAVYNGTTFDCAGDANAPVFDGAPLNAANINLQLDSTGAVVSHECFYTLTDEQLFG